jgi:phosphoglycerate dehydrogenase-like enzyme
MALVLIPQRTFPLHLETASLTRLRQLLPVAEPLPCQSLEDAQLASLCPEIEVLVTGWGTPALDPGIVDTLPKLKLVAHMAGSVKKMIPPELLSSGIRITQAAAANAVPVAEYTLATILLANKRALHWVQTYRASRSSVDKHVDPGLGNFGRTVGIVGASHVGRLVIEMLRQHDLKVLVADPFMTSQEAEVIGARLVPMPDLLEASDVVSLHLPLLPETSGAFGAPELARMRDGAVLINTARGAVIDQRALEAELVTGRIEAVLDVTDPEPLPADSSLWSLPNVVLTPHIAGSIGNETRRMTDAVLDEIERYLRGEPLCHQVDPKTWDRAA